MAQPARGLGRPLRLGPRQQDGELVASDAEDSVAWSERFSRGCGQTCEQTIAFGMPFAVVDHLEIVQIDEHERERHPVPICQFELMRELFLEGAVVAQTRQSVVQRVLACLPVERLQVGPRLTKLAERPDEQAHEDQHADERSDTDHHQHQQECGRHRLFGRGPGLDEPETGGRGGGPEVGHRRDPSRTGQRVEGLGVVREDAVGVHPESPGFEVWHVGRTVGSLVRPGHEVPARLIDHDRGHRRPTSRRGSGQQAFHVDGR